MPETAVFLPVRETDALEYAGIRDRRLPSRAAGRLPPYSGMNYFIIREHDIPPEDIPLPESNLQAPEFELADAQGYPVSLSTFHGRLNVLLVFTRGLACPFCRRHLTQLRWDAPAFESRRTVILAITPDRPEQVRSYWEHEQLPYPGFTDTDNRVASLYRQTVDLFGLGRLPSVVIVDRRGLIRYRYDGSSAPDLPSNETLLKELDRINREDATR
jgi:peroxiredoxin